MITKYHLGKKLQKAILITMIIGTTALYAGDGHNHSHDEHGNANSHENSHGYESLKNEISKESVIKIAKQEVIKLVKEKKIHKSWKNMPVSKIGKTHYGDSNDWKVGFDNLKIKNKAKQTLYIFVSIRGEIRGANYTGN